MNSDRRRGMVLLAVLWTVALLATLAMAAATTFRGFTSIMAIDRDRLQAEALLTAGLEVGAGLASSIGETPLIDVQSMVTLSRGAVRVRIADEGGFIDIGKAPVALLASLLRAVGAGDADTLAGAIVAWRKSDAAAGPAAAGGRSGGNAVPAGRSASGANGAQDAEPDSLFTDVAQLGEVPGMSPRLVAAVAPLVTVFGNATVNPLTAPPAVLAALPGIDPARLAAFLDARRFATDPKQIAASLGAAPTYLEVKPPQAVRVHLAAALSDGYAAAAEAVIVCLPKDRQPYRVLAWNPSWSLRP